MTETNPLADTRAADLLVADARRAVHESLTFLAAPEADRMRALIADLETAVEGRTAIRFTAAAAVPASAPTDRLATRGRIVATIERLYNEGAVYALEPGQADLMADALVGELLPALAACSDPIECSHEAALGELAELRSRLADYENRITWETTCGSCARVLDSSIRETERAEKAEAAVARVRRLHDRLATETELASPDDRITRADAAKRIAAALDYDAASGPGRADGKTQQDETQARRGDAFEAWLKTQRDQHDSDGTGDHEMYDVLDNLRDEYRLHADTGTPLREHVCEGRTVGDCECLEQPAAVSQPGKEAGVCGPAPDQCDAETGEPCAKHEIERSHIEGDHSLCRSADCEVLRQS
ncbi:hypothetical protein [Streptomyces sp. NPDC058202]|uniref:hypothetical protein n=1 Tax=Streptomyces sp. NPDC058202 TaxID=3346380 RepID=UPI0036E4FE0B